MAKFFVGQRVRIKWSLLWPELAGKEGVISEKTSYRDERDDPMVEWMVVPDGWSRAYDEVKKAWFCPHSDQIEPITDRNEVTTWEKCAWSPHGVSA